MTGNHSVVIIKGSRRLSEMKKKTNTGFFGDHIDFFSDLRRDPFYIY